MARLRRAALIVAGVIGAALVAVLALYAVHAGESLPGVRLAGVDVGGLGPDDVRATVADVVAARQTDPVTFEFEGTDHTLVPGDDAYRVDLDAAVEAALAPGRDGTLGQDLWAHVSALWSRRVDAPLPDELDPDAVAAFIEDTSDAVDIAPFPGGVSADPTTLQVTTQDPHEGRAVQRDAMAAAIAEAIATPGPDDLELPVAVDPPRTDGDDLDALAERASRALEAPLTLTVAEQVIVLEPTDLARLIGAAEERDGETARLVLHVDPDAALAVLAPFAPQVDVDAIPARLDITSTHPTFDVKGDATFQPEPADVQVVPGQDGRRLNSVLAAVQLSDLLDAGTHEAELELQRVPPDTTEGELTGLGITHLLGSFTTYHDCCQARVDNIHRIADILDGTVVRPGEQFSVNGIVGERTAEKGFVPAPAIYQGELRDEIGGGISQFGTTSFNAIFFAGMPLDAWHAHSLYISRYPMGRESTLHYPLIDVAFTNDTPHGILFDTSYTSTSLTVSIFGADDGREVSAVMHGPTNYRDYPTRYRENSALRPGSSRVIQTGTDGFDVAFERVIRRGSTETVEELDPRRED